MTSSKSLTSSGALLELEIPLKTRIGAPCCASVLRAYKFLLSGGVWLGCSGCYGRLVNSYNSIGLSTIRSESATRKIAAVLLLRRKDENIARFLMGVGS